MNRPSPLQTYCAIRSTILDIRQEAEAIDEHIGRAQIFGTRQDLAHAMDRSLSLQRKVQELKLQLRRCARTTDQLRQAVTVSSVEPDPSSRAMRSKALVASWELEASRPSGAVDRG